MSKKRRASSKDARSSKDRSSNAKSSNSQPPSDGAPKGTSGSKTRSRLPAFGFSDDLLTNTNEATSPSESADSQPSESQPSAPQASDETPETTATSAAPSSSEAPPSEDKPSTVELPAFGFAEDLLRDIRARKEKEAEGANTAEVVSDGATSPEITASSEGTGPSDDAPISVEGVASAESLGTTPAPEATDATDFQDPFADPERIFRFADSLDDDSQAEAAKAEQRITTWITFSLADGVFAVPVEPVREVIRVASITRVPHAPRPIRGVTNLRGKVIPVIDLRVRIGLSPAPTDLSARVIVVQSKGRLLGLLVDAVHQVAHIDLNQVQQPPEDVLTDEGHYLAGVFHQGEGLILMIDVDRTLVLHDVPIEAANAERGAA